MPYSLQLLSLEDIDEHKILQLLEEGKLELKQLEYKRDLPFPEYSKDSSRRAHSKAGNPLLEFARDVSAMANAEGGDIIFGIDEETMTISSFDIPNWDEFRLRLTNVILSHIEPKLLGFDFHRVPLNNGDCLVVLRIQRSYFGPHRISSGTQSFYIRHSGGKHPMDTAQIRAAFLSSGNLIERARNWSDDRVSKIIEDKGHMRLEQGPRQVLHIVPLNFSDPSSIIDLKYLAENANLIPPLPSSTHMKVRYNADGVLTYRTSESGRNVESYLEIYRDGRIESARIVETNSAVERSLLAYAIEEELLTALVIYLKTVKNVGVSLPLLVCLSYFDVSMMGVLCSANRGASQLSQNFTIAENRIPARDVLLIQWPQANEIPNECRYLVESIWNASGYATSELYNEQGIHKYEGQLRTIK